MKKIIFSVLFFLAIAGVASAQAKRTSRHRNAAISATASQPETQETGAIKNPHPTNSPSIAAEPDNRKEYMQDGQLATYTGHEATPVNSDEFQSIKKDHQDEKEDQ